VPWILFSIPASLEAFQSVANGLSDLPIELWHQEKISEEPFI
jgi:hypothetical protein